MKHDLYVPLTTDNKIGCLLNINFFNNTKNVCLVVNTFNLYNWSESKNHTDKTLNFRKSYSVV